VVVNAAGNVGILGMDEALAESLANEVSAAAAWGSAPSGDAISHIPVPIEDADFGVAVKGKWVGFIDSDGDVGEVGSGEEVMEGLGNGEVKAWTGCFAPDA
jgi:hypothetical protein